MNFGQLKINVVLEKAYTKLMEKFDLDPFELSKSLNQKSEVSCSLFLFCVEVENELNIFKTNVLNTSICSV